MANRLLLVARGSTAKDRWRTTNEVCGAFAEMRIYISDKGRPFSRLTLAVANKRGKLKPGSSDAADGEGSAGNTSFNRNISFRGATMATNQPPAASAAHCK
jgi:hypothetical protein